MEQNDTSQTKNNDVQEQGPRKSIVIIVILLLLGTNGLLLWQFFDKKNSLDTANQTIQITTNEKNELQSQLNRVKADFEKVKADNTNLNGQLDEQDRTIKELQSKVQKLLAIGGPAQIAQAKAELQKLKTLNTQYVVQIDSLNKVNSELTANNSNLNSSLTAEKSKNNSLSDENVKLAGKVQVGSILKAEKMMTQGLKYRANGKEVVTNKAKTVQKVRTTFTLGDNKVIDPGRLDIFVRVLGPDGAVMSSTNETFMSNGQQIVYTTKETVDYQNKDTEVNVEWAKGTQFVKGKYNIEIYQSGTLIGKDQIELK